MSADIGVQWTSATTACGSDSRSSSISSLPPLPDLIPIRKGATTPHVQSVSEKSYNNLNNVAIQSSSSSSNGISKMDPENEQHRESIDKETFFWSQSSTDLKPTVAELSAFSNSQRTCENGNYLNKNSANNKLSASIKTEVNYDSEVDSVRTNSVDAVEKDCIGTSTNNSYESESINMIQCNAIKDSDQLMQVHALNNSSFAMMNEMCQNGVINSNNSSNINGETNSDQMENISFLFENNENNFKENEKQTLNKQSVSGGKKRQNVASNIPKRTTRSALDTYECKARLYTPLPAHYYSVRYARAANRKPKRNSLKAKGRCNSVKAGPKSKTKSKNVSSTLKNGTKKPSVQTASKINPIFLFVKREDTRIIEVRCEDYDKRNRIRLTKTASGWRATPRTDNSTTISSAMLPKVMVKRLDEPSMGKANPNNNRNENSETWRINPFSENRIFISKEACAPENCNNTKNNNNNSNKNNTSNNNNNDNNNNNNSNNNHNNNNDSKFDGGNCYGNRHPSNIATTSSNAEHSSGIETSASDKLHDAIDSVARKKHKKKKKKKKEKHKTKMEKTANQFVYVSGASPMQTQYMNDDGKAHATHPHSTAPKSHVVQRCVDGSASECKFTIRLSKNGESSFIAAKKNSITSVPLPSSTPSVAEFAAIETPTGIKLTKQKCVKHTSSNEQLKDSDPTSLHPISPNEAKCDRYRVLEAMGLQNDNSNVNSIITNGTVTDAGIGANENGSVLVENIDCKKIDTKKEVVTPVVSPYHQQHPSLSSSPQLHQPIPTMNNAEAIALPQAPSSVSIATKSNEVVVSSCRNSHIDTTLSPDNAPAALVETFDSQLAVKQRVESRGSAAAAPFVRSDNNNSCNSSDNKHLDDCVDLLDESSYYDDVDDIQISEPHQVDNENELREYHDLIAGIQNISEPHDNEISNQCGDNTMTGTDLIDSLVERGCKDNNISSEENTDLKETICLSDDYNDVETNLLLNSQPVGDIFRLNERAMTSSPKCLSFNEAGEIEGLNVASLFSNSKSDSDSLVPFHRTSFEDISLTLKGLEKQTNQNTNEKDNDTTTIVSPDSCEDDLPKDLSFKRAKNLLAGLRTLSPRPISRSSDAIQSPQPSGLPAVPPSPDILLALHQQSNKNQNKKQNSLFLDISLPSPKSSDLSSLGGKTDFLDLSSPLSKDDSQSNNNNRNDNNDNSTNLNKNNNGSRSILKRTLQKEPLDLGKHRKSASPTVSCSEDLSSIRSDDGEPPTSRVKTEHRRDSISLETTSKHTSQTDVNIASVKDPDPLTQLRLLISNPEWKLPDPILVPKNRLNAVLASPAREIPLLLTTRPELRLPEAFAYPSILQDPDILVISFAQLETIIRKQNEFMKVSDGNKDILATETSATTQSLHQSTKNHPVQDPIVQQRDRKNVGKLVSPREKAHPKSITANRQEPTSASPTLAGSNNNNNLAKDINSATLEALNQMFWLPYLSQISQMGQLTPDLIKTMAMPNLALQQQAFAGSNRFGLQNPLTNLNSPPLDLPMWQDAATSKATVQRILELNGIQDLREAQRKAINEAKIQQRNQENIAAATAAALQQQNLMQQSQSQKMNQQLHFQNRTAQHHQKTPQSPGVLSSIYGKDHSNDAQQRSPNLQSPPLSKRSLFGSRDSIAPNHNPFFTAPNPMANLHNHFATMSNLQKYGMSNSNSNNVNNTAATNLRKARKDHLYQQLNHQPNPQQQQLHSLIQQQNIQHSQNAAQIHQSNDARPRVTCKSLMNLLQQPDFNQLRSERTAGINENITKLSTNMSMPTFDLSPTQATPINHSSHSNQPKLKVKQGLHLLDPLAGQRRLLNDGNSHRVDHEIGTTSNGIDDIMLNSGILK